MADLNPESKNNDTSPSTSTDISSPGMDISDSSLLPFTTQEISLSVLDDPHQLSHGDTEHISTQPFRKCSISTKITDLRRCWFRDGRVGGEGKREACVIVFELEFGDQIRGSGQRITEMGVWVLVEEVDEEEGGGTNTPSQPTTTTITPIHPVPSPDLAIKAIYPRSLTGSLTELNKSTTFSAELNPSANGFSAGTVGISRSSAHVEPHWATYTSSTAGSQGVKLNLTENEVLRSGIPARLRVAVLMQTDGLPFDVEIRFKGAARSWGVKVGGKVAVSVGRRYLWFRGGNGEEKGVEGGKGEVRFDEDADSEGFREWVRSKTGNAWAEGVEWE